MKRGENSAASKVADDKLKGKRPATYEGEIA
jgi:hypothetical protein